MTFAVALAFPPACAVETRPRPTRRERRGVRFDGNDEMEEAGGHGWAELQDDGSLEGEVCLENGDDISFIARRSSTSSTAC